MNSSTSTEKRKSEFDILKFWEGDFLIHYIPELELSSYGRNENQAQEMMNIALDDFFENKGEINV